MFWEAIKHLQIIGEHLLTSSICPTYMESGLPSPAVAINRISETRPTCVGSIDGMVLEILRPKRNLAKRIIYKGHKRKHALKYQAVNTPYGMIVLLHGPLDGRGHDWTLYVRSGLDEMLPDVLQSNGIRYCIYGDLGYNSRWFMEVPFKGASVTAA